jgi:hypothetical protein
MSDPMMKSVLTSMLKNGFLCAAVFGTVIGVSAACCGVNFGVLHEGPTTEKNDGRVRLKPEIRAQLNSLSRVELFIGGIHVGTIILDGTAGVFIGPDPTQAGKVLQELLSLLHLVAPEPEEEDYY